MRKHELEDEDCEDSGYRDRMTNALRRIFDQRVESEELLEIAEDGSIIGGRKRPTILRDPRGEYGIA